MGVQLRLPDIKGDDHEQLRRIRSYLYQLVPQLQWALEASEVRTEAESGALSEVPGAQSVLRSRTAVPTEMGLSSEVAAPERVFGRGGAGCRYREREGRVSVSFSCGAQALPARVSAGALPEACRPKANVFAVCHAEFAEGEYGTACACVCPDGHVVLLAAQGHRGAQNPIAVDGFVEFFV